MTFHLYRLFDAADQLLYIGLTSKRPADRLSEHRDKPWRDDVARMDVRILRVSEAEAKAAEAAAIKAENPRHNRQRYAYTPKEVRPPPAVRRDGLEPCGTYAAARRHIRDGIPRDQLDPECAVVLRRYQADAAKRARDKRAGR